MTEAKRKAFEPSTSPVVSAEVTQWNPRPRAAQLARQSLATSRYAQRSATKPVRSKRSTRTLRITQRCSFGGILSPCLANIALTVLDEHFTRKWEALGPHWKRAKLRRQGVPAHRIIRYADDFVRHEAPYDRAEMKGLRREPVAAGS